MQLLYFSRVGQSRLASFTIVETCVAIAIVAVALVSLIALLPTGLNNFRTAMDAQTAAEIFQRVIADAQETDFDTLLASQAETGGRGSQFYRLPLRYFDGQGTELKIANPDAPTAIEATSILYTARIRGSRPGAADPGSHTDDFATSLPGANAPRFNPRGLTFLTIQIAGTCGSRRLAPMVDSETFLISPPLAAKAAMPVRTYAAIIARNGYQ